MRPSWFGSAFDHLICGRTPFASRREFGSQWAAISCNTRLNSGSLFASCCTLKSLSARRTTAEKPNHGRLTDATSRRTVCVHRQSELKHGAVGHGCRGPQPATVGFHDRTADRQPHAHAAQRYPSCHHASSWGGLAQRVRARRGPRRAQQRSRRDDRLRRNPPSRAA